MSTYSNLLNKQPQTSPIFGRSDMVKNNATGYSFKITPEQQLERFILMGTVGGTFYVSEQKLTVDNIQIIVDLIKTDGEKVLKTLLALKDRAVKQDPVVFTLALLCTYGSQNVKNLTYRAINTVCRTGTQFLTFVSEVNNMRGWSNGLRKAVANWYLTKSPEDLAYQVTKYQNRSGFTHRDVIRLSHPKTKKDVYNSILAYVSKSKRQVNLELLPNIIKVQEAAKTASREETLDLIKSSSLTWEMIKTEYLNDGEILTSLLPKMGYVALLRNLNRLSAHKSLISKVVSKVKDNDAIKKSKVHPFTILNALRVYSKGSGDRGSKVWDVSQKICDALNEAIYVATINNVDASGKNVLLAVDVSRSMSHPASNSTTSCKDVAALMSALTLKTEDNSELIWFDTQVYKPNVGARTSFEDILKATPSGGGTDCSLAFQYMLHTKVSYDAIVIYTDNETWAGKQHSLPLLEMCRKINPDLKVIEVAAQANSYSNLPEDKNLLRIVGFDANVNILINNFIKGSN